MTYTILYLTNRVSKCFTYNEGKVVPLTPHLASSDTATNIKM